jgi:hypothetical protein
MMPICVARAVSVGEFIASALGGPAGSRAFANPEVEHLHRAVIADFDVRRLEITWWMILPARRFGGFRDLLRDGKGVGKQHRAARDDRRQVLTLDQLHHEGSRAPLSKPWMCAMLGWFKEASTSASR